MQGGEGLRTHKRGRGVLWSLAGGLFLAAGVAFAGEQADRAVAAVRQLVAEGALPAGAVLRLTVKQGNLASFLGEDEQLKTDWEQATGTVIDARVMPQLASRAFIRKDAAVDLTIARSHEMPDLVSEGLVAPLSPLFERFGFALPDRPPEGYVHVRQQAFFDGQIVAIPADGDAPLLFLRQDLMDDPARQAAFLARFGRPLAPPRTWAEYQTLVAFFDRSDEGFYGALEPRDTLTGWMYWVPRFLAHARPGQHLFDDAMHPQIDSPEGVAATASYLATLPYSPPGVRQEGNDYSYTLPLFLGGKGFSTIITVAAAKLATNAASPVLGKVVAAPMPGRIEDGRVVPYPTLIYGNNLVIPARARQTALAFLFAMWLTDPDISARSVGVAGGFTDPYRYHHFDDPRIRAVYGPAFLDVARAQLPYVAPAGTGLPGDSAYLDALSDNLSLAARGGQSAAEAMRNTARQWEAITERLGRPAQIAHWRRFRAAFPTVSSAAAPAD
ncbi:MAG: extracellular solute-binding protein [Proteobacteria bacterium]|nr:MAG: extracellular solute-binding protein [Pseudomonadota bacterium]